MIPKGLLICSQANSALRYCHSILGKAMTIIRVEYLSSQYRTDHPFRLQLIRDSSLSFSVVLSEKDELFQKVPIDLDNDWFDLYIPCDECTMRGMNEHKAEIVFDTMLAIVLDELNDPT